MDALTGRRAAGIALVLTVAVALGLVLVGRDGSPGQAAAQEPATPDTVTVTGVGSASAPPDTLSADFRVQVTRATVQEALDAQAAAAHRLIDALKKAGVPGPRLQTTDLSIDRHYDEHGTVVGYDAAETIEARISPLDRAGRTISAGATASGNDVEVGSISFDIAHDDALVHQARGNAFADARARATQYADLAGRSLGRVLSVSEHVSAPSPRTYYGMAALDRVAAPRPVPVKGGRQSLSVRVRVVWALS